MVEKINLCEDVVTREICTCSSDTIIFDAMRGSRAGRMQKTHASARLATFADADTFARALLAAQMRVLLAQLLFFLGQCTGAAVVARICVDVMHSNPDLIGHL